MGKRTIIFWAFRKLWAWLLDSQARVCFGWDILRNSHEFCQKNMWSKSTFHRTANSPLTTNWMLKKITNIPYIPFYDDGWHLILIGGWTNPFGKICMHVKLGITSPRIGVKIPKMFELPPPFDRKSLYWVYKPLLLGWWPSPTIYGNNRKRFAFKFLFAVRSPVFTTTSKKPKKQGQGQKESWSGAFAVF